MQRFTTSAAHHLWGMLKRMSWHAEKREVGVPEPPQPG